MLQGYGACRSRGVAKGGMLVVRLPQSESFKGRQNEYFRLKKFDSKLSKNFKLLSQMKINLTIDYNLFKVHNLCCG
jgi:hypothetical protein